MKLSLALSALLAGFTAAQNIVEIGLANPDDFSTLTDLVIAADLVEPLSTLENITLFAPVNDAFDVLPEDIVTNLGTEPWKVHLQNVLAYHVAESLIASSDIENFGSAAMLNGEPTEFTISDTGVVTINGVANVTTVDIAADNGLIHVIDAVLLPSWVFNSIVDRLANSSGFSILAGLATDLGLLDTLASPGPFTVFAPGNPAFDGAPSLNETQLTSVLTYHVVPGLYSSEAISDGLVLTTAQGEDLTFSVTEEGALVNGVPIVLPNILANNGIIHAIGGILIPAAVSDGGATTMPPADGTPTAMPPAGGDSPSMAPVSSSAARAFPAATAAATMVALLAGGMALAL